MLGAHDSLNDGQQRGKLVASLGRVSCPRGPVGEVGAGVESAGVLGSIVLAVSVCVRDQHGQVPSRPVAPAVPEVLRDSRHPTASAVAVRAGGQRDRPLAGRPRHRRGHAGAYYWMLVPMVSLLTLVPVSLGGTGVPRTPPR